MTGRLLEGPKFRFSIEEKTLGTFFFNSVEKYSDNVCQIDGIIDESQTYGFVKTKSVRMAISMQNRGVTPSSVIAVISANTLDNTIPMLAAFYLGAKVTSLDPSFPLEYLRNVIVLITPRMIFVEESAVELIENCLVAADFETEVVVFGRSKKYSSYSTLIQPHKNEQKFKPTKVDPEDVALLVYTCGVTGPPKIVCHSHRSFLCIILRSYQIRAHYFAIQVGSLYWLASFIVMACCFKGGNFRVFAHSVTAENMLKMVETYLIYSTLMNRLATYVNTNSYDTSSIQVLAYGGAPMPPFLFNKMRTLFPNATVSMLYGTTEVGVATAFDIELDLDLAKTKVASCGKAAALVQIKIANIETDHKLGPNQKGEIRLKSPSMMVAYYKDESSYVVDDQGFFKTGDLGFYDEDNCVYVFDKLTDVFKYDDTLIIPSVIEAALLEHPAIKEAAVFGLPFDGKGQIPAACVVLKENCVLKQEEIDSFLMDKVEDRERLRGGVNFLSNLPKTLNVKILRQEVRNLVIKSKGG